MIGNLTDFISKSLTTQDKVITSLKTGQESMDRRMSTMTDNYQKQMDTMNNTMINLQRTMLRIVGVPEEDFHQQCGMDMQTQDSNLGIATVPLGGLHEL